MKKLFSTIEKSVIVTFMSESSNGDAGKNKPKLPEIRLAKFAELLALLPESSNHQIENIYRLSGLATANEIRNHRTAEVQKYINLLQGMNSRWTYNSGEYVPEFMGIVDSVLNGLPRANVIEIGGGFCSSMIDYTNSDSGGSVRKLLNLNLDNLAPVSDKELEKTLANLPNENPVEIRQKTAEFNKLANRLSPVKLKLIGEDRYGQKVVDYLAWFTDRLKEKKRAGRNISPLVIVNHYGALYHESAIAEAYFLLAELMQLGDVIISAPAVKTEILRSGTAEVYDKAKAHIEAMKYLINQGVFQRRVFNIDLGGEDESISSVAVLRKIR